jgi:FkbM family methyltransferase
MRACRHPDVAVRAPLHGCCGDATIGVAGARRRSGIALALRLDVIRVLRVVASAALDCAYLLRSRHRLPTKLRILFEYGRLTLKLIVWAPFVSLRRERLLGFQVEAFDYQTLHFLFSEIFVRNQYWVECPDDRPLIFDCGANIGLATIFFKWRHPQSTIHCFEPDRRTFELLKRNVEVNRLPDVHLHNVALSNAVGTVEFFVAARQAGSLLMSMNPQRIPAPEVEKTLVDCTKLSQFVNGRRVDLLKMDVEGAEPLVVADLVESGSIGMIDALVVEYHHDVDRRSAHLGEFLCVLEDAGFKYQVDVAWGSTRDEFQDVLLHAYRPESPGSAVRGTLTRV